MSAKNNNNENNLNNNNDDEIDNFVLMNNSYDIKEDNKICTKTMIKSRTRRNNNHQIYESVHLSLRSFDNKNQFKNNNINENNNGKEENQKIEKEDEEKRKKKELEEKEKNKIRDKLKCFICFGKVINARMCIKCRGIACEECIKKMLSKNKICNNCKQLVRMEEMIKLPFLNDLTSFFINNFEQKKKDIKKNLQYNKLREINDNKKLDIIKIDSCKFHPRQTLEYLCINCKEYLCSECLLFFNKKNVIKHKDHIILSKEQINEFNLNEIIKEYKNLSDLKINIDKNIVNYKLFIIEIEILKRIGNDSLESIKNDLSKKYIKKLKEIKIYFKFIKQ